MNTVGQAVPATAPAGCSPPSPLSVRRRRHCHSCCQHFEAGTVRQLAPATAAETTTHRRHRRQQHSRGPLTCLPAQRLPPPLPRLLLSLCSGYGWASGTGDRPCRSLTSVLAPQSPLPLARLPLVEAAAASRSGCRWERGHEGDQRHRDNRPSSTLEKSPTTAGHLPYGFPFAAAVAAAAAAFSKQRVRLGKRYRRSPLPAAHLHPRSPFAADVATAAAIVYQRVRFGKWYQRQPLPAAHLPPRPRSPQPLTGLRPSLCSGYG